MAPPCLTPAIRPIKLDTCLSHLTQAIAISNHLSLNCKMLKGNDTVQIHFNYSYKLWIFFHTVRFAYRKVKDARKLGASNNLRKKEIFEDVWSILEFQHVVQWE